MVNSRINGLGKFLRMDKGTNLFFQLKTYRSRADIKINRNYSPLSA